ncbi:MAG: N-acetylmuramoyl-L-alanine amidase [Vicinamibacterales bacterium]
MSPRSALILLLVTSAGASGWAGQTSPSGASGLTLLSAAGRQAIPTTTAGGREMVTLSDLARIFGLSIREDPVVGGLTVAYKGKTIALTPDQSVASVGGRLVSMPGPVVRDGQRWLVPVEFLDRALARVYEPPLDVRLRSRLVVLGPLRVPRVVARQEALGGQARLTIEVTPAAGETIVQEAGRLVVRFDADALDAALPASGVPGLIESVQLSEAGTAVVIDLGKDFASFRATTTPDAGARRVVIDLLAAAAAPAAGAVDAPAPPPLPGFGGTPTVRAVVIDPGHGGDESGSRGPGGSLEKDVTLGVSRRLKALLEGGLGVRVLLTRDGDTPVSADERAALANNNKADVFVSLHANASLRAETTGPQVYYMSAAGLEEAVGNEAPGAALLPVVGGGFRSVDVIPWEVAQTRHLSRSAELAALVREELAGRLEVNDRPVQQAPLRVLLGANMPAVLVEMGFLSNADEEARLRSPEHQGLLAQALYAAISKFKDRGFSPARIP